MPVKAPAKFVLAVTTVPVIAKADDPPMTAPSIVPPLISAVASVARPVVVAVVNVLDVAELAPIIVPSIAPPLMSTVVSVDVPVAAKAVNVPAAAELPPIVTPSIVPALMSAVSATRLSMLAVPSINKSLNCKLDVPRSMSLLVTGTTEPS